MIEIIMVSFLGGTIIGVSCARLFVYMATKRARTREQKEFINAYWTERMGRN